MYPKGIHLFYDMFSMFGLLEWSHDVLWAYVYTVLSPMTGLVPMDLIYAYYDPAIDSETWNWALWTGYSGWGMFA